MNPFLEAYIFRRCQNPPGRVGIIIAKSSSRAARITLNKSNVEFFASYYRWHSLFRAMLIAVSTFK
jgi:hypothetical protein